ncbi:2-amino-4-hydroxy-6-hydroxymethyldihydropteridine diphosphokinase [Phocoenobacter skyensis]|uniref:2-amino-4-hydroxy-6-hydroxymethyldihydropteridine pyrophosphokinase n=1 Tax=Phocoenobacter skyensis TaxID=97481 RepID=A0A1H8A971_9PAST|nr:2-amino-4-hydroxy-6-hydroxymethyldihydropteridine diphosphokinase [Pasteurella skyensis]MDP8080308.1 2-amino-4-hydroxy-6-hydroxymethyldihydropteridine diphosphokinase [Pasteurella skyensis]MDP8086309.1 2-amino-4-hydroxy-6-hydroxymethyldihydropteridine diphosphokinase [Pasteurella skyensis]MDP8186121.1 2-amino-4-hydroxy-6-hydroxymethyldihydropteridine diphosphokinase [Pasteurella skyensis]QLB22961.1 2-amino-4-hydroxy-6-hydroxymethyldihydropteridine diphosphokinase [Pasteurella skyensis]SEM66
MTKVYIALGSNLNNPLVQLKQAVRSLQKFANFKISSFYTSQPLGPQDQPDYINAVASFETDLSPLELLDYLQNIENQQGRVRLRRWGERTLDLDILLFGKKVITSDRLIVPHYDMHHREFVIVPLYELDPKLILPNEVTLESLYTKFQDHKMVKINEKKS